MNRPAGVTTPARLEKLSLMLAIRGLPKGHHTAMLSITFPNGTLKFSANPAQVTVPELGDAINLQLAFAPFEVREPGVFALDVKIAGLTVHETFTILHRDLSQKLTELTLRPQPPIPVRSWIYNRRRPQSRELENPPPPSRQARRRANGRADRQTGNCQRRRLVAPARAFLTCRVYQVTPRRLTTAPLRFVGQLAQAKHAERSPTDSRHRMPRSIYGMLVL